MELALRVAELQTVQVRRSHAEQSVLDASHDLVTQCAGYGLAADLLTRQRRLSLLEDAVVVAIQQVTEAQAVVDKATAEVVERRANAEVAQKLVDQDRQRYRHEIQKQQQHDVDEFAIRHAYRNSELG
jgi:flagellar biosynthesis chaperone FliJ